MEELIREELLRNLRKVAEDLFEKTGFRLSEATFHWISDSHNEYFFHDAKIIIN